jgi:hypothetical protein
LSSPPTKLSSLRQLLAERYPQAARTEARRFATAVPAIDESVGGLPCGAITEIVCATPGCGSELLIGELLHVTRRARGRVALIDGHDSFDPQSCPEEWLEHLVWARCENAEMALHAADIVSRDANFSLVMLDLRRARAGELRKTPSTFWYRLQRSVEPADLVLVVLTAQATVPSAQLRLQLERTHGFAALNEKRPTLVSALTPLVQRQRLSASA